MPATPASSVTTLQAENPVTVSDRVEINTASGSPMILSFSTDLNGINKGNEDLNYTSDITFFTSDFATRDFNAVPNTQNNQSEEGIFSEVTINGPRRHLWIQSGADAPDGIDLSWEPMNNSTLGIVGTKVNPREKALKAIAQLDKALDKVLGERTTFGANQNRLEHAYQINLNVVENTDAAESRIRDTDMAAETVRFTKEGMLQQVGQTMLAQANQNRQGILSLLQ
ncbi:MAG: flagellin [Lachnospiraceae bacterium]|nr:flagellin [Lachnospiraceae bacterium]